MTDNKPFDKVDEWLIKNSYPEVMQGISRVSLADIINRYVYEKEKNQRPLPPSEQISEDLEENKKLN